MLPPSHAELAADPSAAGEQIHQMVLSYEFDVAAPSGDAKDRRRAAPAQSRASTRRTAATWRSRRAALPAEHVPLSERARARAEAIGAHWYDSPFDSMLSLEDARGAVHAYGGLIHDADAVALREGAVAGSLSSATSTGSASRPRRRRCCCTCRSPSRSSAACTASAFVVD